MAEAMKVSAVDYHEAMYGKPNQSMPFDKYSQRTDNFLTKSQARLILKEKGEAQARLQRMQELKEEKEKEERERGDAPPKRDAQQQIRFKYTDHSRVIEMKPYIDLMKDTIIMNCREKK